MNVRSRGKNLKSGIAWNFNCCKKIKHSRGKNDGIICRYLALNDIGEKKIFYSDYVNFQRTNHIDSILS